MMADLAVIDITLLAGEANQAKEALDMLRTLKQAGRPLMLARDWTSPLNRPLLALDSVSGIDATLFLATYMAERWEADLSILVDSNVRQTDKAGLERVAKYLILHEVEAPLLFSDTVTATTIAAMANDHGCDLIVMNWPATGRICGRPSNDVIAMLLDNCQQPILICP